MSKSIVMPCNPGFNNILGKVFGELTVISYKGMSTYGKRLWECSCSCGNTKVIAAPSLTYGRTKSCGCVNRKMVGDRFRKHGLRKTPEYYVWAGLIARCTNPNYKQYSDYGGRGITVCHRWKTSFQKFIQDMGKRPSSKHQIDRKDNEKGYSPNNCRWVTAKENANNRRPRGTRMNKYAITIDFPPSVNHYYTVFRGRKILSSAGKKYKQLALSQIRKQIGAKPKKLTGRLRIYFGFSHWIDLDYDISNFVKAAEDVVSGVLFVDDCQIDTNTQQRLPKSDSGHCEVIVEQIPKEEQIKRTRKKPAPKKNTGSIYSRLKRSGRKRST